MYGRSGGRRVEGAAVADQSHRDEMSAAIRAQRARNAVPKTIAPPPPPAPPAAAVPRPEPEPERSRSLFRRLFGK
jgi:hypothetical protein